MKSYHQKQQKNSVSYKSDPIQGECILKHIKCLRFVNWKFLIFCSISALTIGIPFLLSYWYPRLSQKFYYDFCQFEDATHFCIVNYDDVITIVAKQCGQAYPKNNQSADTIYFVNRHLKYCYDTQENCFTPVCYDYIPLLNNLVNTYKISGHSRKEVIQLKDYYGKGAMVIPTPNCITLFLRQILQPFFFFILYSVILWFYQEYNYYSTLIVITSITTIGINLWQIMELNNKIFEMAYCQIKIHVLRDGQISQISSIEIVPGDVVLIKNPIKLPFDALLLGGSVLVNECALTGQSIPIVKKSVDKQEFNSKKKIDRNCFLFEGTQLIQVCSKSHNPVHNIYSEYGLVAYVIRTNFSTIRGQLIRSIIFPKDRQMLFYIESAKFVIVLFFLAVLSYCILIIRLFEAVPFNQLLLKFLDLITITVPPGLPTSMSVGIAFSIRRLKTLGIFCISPDKIIIGGKINHICFDKTGTLTQLYMDFYQYIPIIDKQFQEAMKMDDDCDYSNFKIMEQPQFLHSLANMGSCHSIMNLQQNNELMGDPMEIKLFKFGKFSLESHSLVDQNYTSHLFSFKGERFEGTVFKRFQFSSDVNRMSVIASSTIDPRNAYIYCKGSPEELIRIMRPEGVPNNYYDTLKKYTSCGFRVLAIASKRILIGEIQSMDRQSAQYDLCFNGFQIFQNKLKPQTVPTIKVLQQAQISIAIITGDNVLTGANIGYKSGIIQSHTNTLICQLQEDGKVSISNFYESISTDEYDLQDKSSFKYQFSVSQAQKTDVNLLKFKTQRTQVNSKCKLEQLPSKAVRIARKGGYVFCITGEIFQLLFTKINQEDVSETKRQFFNYVKVFARAKPNDKTKVISLFQSLGKITAMCGDGANDCGALKQADAGLSLSEVEASISAPFTSKVPNISSIVFLIRECRAGLASNFSLFNIMALYSLTQYTSTVITQYFYAYPSDMQYLFWDIACNFFFFVTVGYTSSQQKLSKQIPLDSLFSLSNLVCVMVMFVLQLICQILSITIISSQPFSTYISYWQISGQENNMLSFGENNEFTSSTLEVTCIFLVSNFLYLFSILGLTISWPWRRPFYTNWVFMIVYLIFFTYSALMCLVPESRLQKFGLLIFDLRARTLLLGLGLIFGLIMSFNQKFVLQPLFRKLRLRFPNKKWL